MKAKIGVIIYALFCFSNVFAQKNALQFSVTANWGKNSIHAFNISEVSSDTIALHHKISNPVRLNIDWWHFFTPQQSVSFSLSGNYHRQINSITNSQYFIPIISGFDNHQVFSQIEIAYLYGFRKKETGFRPFIGVQQSVEWSYIKSIPLTSNFFENRSQLFSSSLSLYGKLICHLNSRLYLSLASPFQLFTFQKQMVRNENPSLSIQEQRTITNAWLFLPKNYLIMLGFGIRLT